LPEPIAIERRRDLAQDAAAVDDSLVDVYPVARAFVDHDALAQRIGLDADDLGELPGLDQRGQAFAQLAQFGVFLLERTGAHGLQLELALVGSQALIFSTQFGLSLEARGQCAPRRTRRVHGHLHGIGGGLQCKAQVLFPLAVLIVVHEHDRQQRIDREAQPGRGSATV
jgi:hypothetical protein